MSRHLMLLSSESAGAAAWLRPAAASMALAGVWFVLAWRTPTATHHFAPLVVAAAWGFVADLDGGDAVRRASAGGIAVAVVTLLALGVSDRLLGPTLWHSRPSWPELLGFTVAGGAITLFRGRRRSAPPSP